MKVGYKSKQKEPEAERGAQCIRRSTVGIARETFTVGFIKRERLKHRLKPRVLLCGRRQHAASIEEIKPNKNGAKIALNVSVLSSVIYFLELKALCVRISSI